VLSVVRYSTGNDFDPDFSRPRPVEFAEIDPLPGAQGQASVVNEKGFGGTDEGRLDVGGRISFRVLIRTGEGDEAVEIREKIVLDARVGVLVDGDGGRGMGDKDDGQAAWRLALLDDFNDLGGDVQKLGAGAGPNGEFLDIHEILPRVSI